MRPATSLSPPAVTTDGSAALAPHLLIARPCNGNPMDEYDASHLPALWPDLFPYPALGKRPKGVSLRNYVGTLLQRGGPYKNEPMFALDCFNIIMRHNFNTFAAIHARSAGSLGELSRRRPPQPLRRSQCRAHCHVMQPRCSASCTRR